MLNLTVPALILIREGITVNLSLCVSQAVERDVPQYRIKPDVKKMSDEGKLNRALKSEDYDEYAKCDTVTFWFIDGRSLAYRVGEEITAEDFVRIEGDLKQIIFVRKK